MLDKHNKIWETHLFTYINAEHHDIKKGALDFIYMLLDMGSKSDTAPNTKYILYEICNEQYITVNIYCISCTLAYNIKRW